LLAKALVAFVVLLYFYVPAVFLYCAYYEFLTLGRFGSTPFLASGIAALFLALLLTSVAAEATKRYLPHWTTKRDTRPHAGPRRYRRGRRRRRRRREDETAAARMGAAAAAG